MVHSLAVLRWHFDSLGAAHRYGAVHYMPERIELDVRRGRFKTAFNAAGAPIYAVAWVGLLQVPPLNPAELDEDEGWLCPACDRKVRFATACCSSLTAAWAEVNCG